MKLCQAKGVLIIPKWCSSYFWPMVHDGRHWAQGIQLIQEYCKPKQFFQDGSHGNAVFSTGTFHSNVLVLKVDYSEKW
jgi:hypothetical protein